MVKILEYFLLFDVLTYPMQVGFGDVRAASFTVICFAFAMPHATILLCRPVQLFPKEKADKLFTYWQRNIGSVSMRLSL